MKTAILILLCAAALLAQPAVTGTPTSCAAAATGLTFTCANTATGGNLLLVALGIRDENSMCAVTDDLGTAYNFVGFVDNGNEGHRIEAFSGFLSGSGSHAYTITATCPNTEKMALGLVEVTGAAATRNIDVFKTLNVTVATPSLALPTTNNATDLIVSMITSRNVTFAGQFGTMRTQAGNGTTDVSIAVATQAEVATGIYTATFTGSSFGSMIAFAVSTATITPAPFICRLAPGRTLNWSTSTQWWYGVDGAAIDGCWGRLPLDADYIRNLGSNVTIDIANWGTTGTGRVRYEQSNYTNPSGTSAPQVAALGFSCAFPQHLVTLSSTGTNSIGTGSLTAPGTDGTVTYQGFYIPTGTLNMSCPSGPQNYPATAQTGATGTSALTKANPTIFTLTGGTMPSSTFGVLIRDSENCTALNPSTGQNPRTGFFYATVTGANTFTVPIDSTACGAWDGQIVIPPIVVSSATGPGTQPTYIRAASNDFVTGFTTAVSLTVKNTLFPNCGVAGSTSVSACVWTSMANNGGSIHTLVLDNSTYLGGFGPLVISSFAFASHEIKSNWVNAMHTAVGSSGNTTLFGTTADGFTYSGNTVTNSAGVNGDKMFATANFATNETITDNATFSSPTIMTGVVSAGNGADTFGGVSSKWNNNLCMNTGARPATNLNGSCISASVNNGVPPDTGSVMKNNISEWMSNSYYVGGGLGNNLLSSGNWAMDYPATAGAWQGTTLYNDGVGNNLVGNVFLFYSPSVCVLNLIYTSAATSVWTVKNNVWGVASGGDCAGHLHTGLEMGEGAGFGKSASLLNDSNVYYGFGNAVMTDTSGGVGNTLTYATSCPLGVGVCRNWTFNSGAYSAPSGNSLNYTDGLHNHPYSGYGDVDGVDPKLLAASRTMETFDSEVLGGPGTYKHLASEFSKRSGFGNCNICGTYTDGGYGANGLTVIGAANAYLLRGSISNEPRTWTAGVGGSDIGLQDAIVHRIPPVVVVQ